ncbi:MAG TPA: hypothetical protein VE079_15880 [Ensifer sp.]|nr:hypothetical protein [Ensifer sp.]
MTGMLPVVEQLLDCESDAERARWLLTVPLIVLYRDQVAIRKALRAASFEDGVRLLDAEIAGLTAVRRRNGLIPATTDLAAKIERTAMMGIVMSAALRGGAL